MFMIELEEIVTQLVETNTFSNNGVSFRLEEFTNPNAGEFNPDLVYYLARAVDDNKDTLQLRRRFIDDVVNPTRVYKAIKDQELKAKINKPSLPFKAYFSLVELINAKPIKYQGEEGYIQLAKDVRDKTGCKANLAHIWSGAREYRKQLNWYGKINLPLQVFETIDELLSNKENTETYKGEEGYIQLAKDVRDKTGCKAHLATIWSGAREYRKQLNWPGKIELPLEVFETIDELLSNKENTETYKGEEGYIQLAKDVRDKTGCKAHLATIWSGAREYRKQLNWPGKINLPLDVYLANHKKR